MAGWEAGQPCSKGPLHTLAFAAEGLAAPTICSLSLSSRVGSFSNAGRAWRKGQNLKMRLKIGSKERVKAQSQDH